MSRAAALCVTTALAGCGETIQARYQIAIGGPDGVDYLAGAKELVLEVNGAVVDRKPFTGARVSLDTSGIDVADVQTATFTVKALDGERLVAFGKSPLVELVVTNRDVLVYVQPPGSLGRTAELEDRLHRHFAVAAPAPPLMGSGGATTLTMPFFGTGEVTVGEGPTAQTVFSNAMFAHHPITHFVELLGRGAVVDNVGAPRADAAAVARGDGTIMVFGGLSKATPESQAVVTSQLDVYNLSRRAFADLQMGIVGAQGSMDMRAARSATVLAPAATAVYAFGGRGAGEAPLDTVVQLTTTGGQAITVLDPETTKMSAPRAGHTATAVTTMAGGTEILVFGGAPAGGQVADLFIPRLPPAPNAPMGDQGTPARFERIDGDPGTGRRDHAALALSDGRVLIAGGLDDVGAPRKDAVLYSARDRAFTPTRFALRHARAAAAAFVIGNDIVFVGGIGEDGRPRADAEIHDANTLELARADVPAHPRARATATVLPHEVAILLGGDEADAPGSRVIEVYQPRRER